LLVAVNVITDESKTGFGEKEAVTPLGRPWIARFTFFENPFNSDTYTDVVVELPCPSVTLPGLESENPGVATVSASEILELRLPEVPVSLMVELPAVAVLPAVKVIVDAPVLGFGENDAVTPLGRPETAKVTLAANPFCGLMPK
jgi:hypothetical protein